MIESADFLFERGGIVIRFAAERFHHVVKPLLGAISHCDPERISRFIGRNLCLVDPSAVRVPEKIVTRFSRNISTGGIESPVAILRFVWRCITSVGEGREAQSKERKSTESWMHKQIGVKWKRKRDEGG